MFDVSDNVVIITGASGNLGLATAHAFQHAGAKTVLVERSTDLLKQNFPDLTNSPDHLLAGDVDLTDAGSVTGMVDQALNWFGRLDVLVNTVGAYRGGTPMHEEDLETWDFLLTLNLRTTLLTCRAVVPVMQRQGQGKIINVASRSGIFGEAGAAAYSASKGAVLRLTESMAEELKQSNITVNAVLPGTIDTPQNRQAMPDADHSTWVAPEAIAEVIFFLGSDAARAVTGAAVPVYGKGL